jgi:hypothetical protein
MAVASDIMVQLARGAAPPARRRQRGVLALVLVTTLAVCAVQIAGAFEAHSINGLLEYPTCSGTGCHMNGQLVSRLQIAPLAGPLRQLIVLIPLLCGLLLGAPLVPEELNQAGPHSDRRRGLFTAIIGRVLGVTLVTGLLALTGAALDQAGDGALFDPWADYDVLVVLCGQSLFALALGVAAGAVLRRAVPAMVLTLVVFTCATALMATSVRPCFLPPLETNPNDVAFHDVTFQHAPAGAWLLDPPQISSGSAAPNTTPCGTTRSDYWYQPASRLWLFQGIETGIYLALAAPLFGLALWLGGRPGRRTAPLDAVEPGPGTTGGGRERRTALPVAALAAALAAVVVTLVVAGSPGFVAVLAWSVEATGLAALGAFVGVPLARSVLRLSTGWKVRVLTVLFGAVLLLAIIAVALDAGVLWGWDLGSPLPVGEAAVSLLALFAVALGFAAGLIIRRTTPAMVLVVGCVAAACVGGLLGTPRLSPSFDTLFSPYDHLGLYQGLGVLIIAGSVATLALSRRAAGPT